MSHSHLDIGFFKNDIFVGHVNGQKRMNVSVLPLSRWEGLRKLKSQEKEWIRCFLQLSLDRSVGQEALRLHLEDPP